MSVVSIFYTVYAKIFCPTVRFPSICRNFWSSSYFCVPSFTPNSVSGWCKVLFLHRLYKYESWRLLVLPTVLPRPKSHMMSLNPVRSVQVSVSTPTIQQRIIHPPSCLSTKWFRTGPGLIDYVGIIGT